MKTENLTDRFVMTLTRDITNPKPDRRMVRNFAALPVWKAGTRLMYRNINGHISIDNSKMYGSVSPRDPGFDALLEACEPAPRTLENILYRAGESRYVTGPGDILETMLAVGKLTLDDIETVIGAYEATEALKGD